MSAAEREAEQRWPQWSRHGAGSSSWGDGARERPAFVAGAEWQADHDHRIDAVRALHQRSTVLTNLDDMPYCRHCVAPWPCATIQAIGGDKT